MLYYYKMKRRCCSNIGILIFLAKSEAGDEELSNNVEFVRAVWRLSLAHTLNRAAEAKEPHVPDSLPEQAQLINCKNIVGYNQILSCQLCCSPAGFLPFRVVTLSLLTAHI